MVLRIFNKNKYTLIIKRSPGELSSILSELNIEASYELLGVDIYYSFQEKLTSKKKYSQKILPNFDVCFDNTVYNRLSFNTKHPFFHNKNFREKLLKYYTEKEEYEKCAELVRDF